MSSLRLTLDVETIGNKPQGFHLLATKEENKSIAKRLNLLSLAMIEADVQVWRKDRIHMTGMIKAELEQECVRTLQPIPQSLNIDIHEVFTIATGVDESEIDLNREDQEEILEASQLDVGEVIIQLLSLHLDPFPVSPTSSPVDYKEEVGKQSPFHILSKK
jgi:uncharacterized metal-binding protein YceD (DUF177 family)